MHKTGRSWMHVCTITEEEDGEKQLQETLRPKALKHTL
jgi:hypothetical protein